MRRIGVLAAATVVVGLMSSDIPSAPGSASAVPLAQQESGLVWELDDASPAINPKAREDTIYVESTPSVGTFTAVQTIGAGIETLDVYTYDIPPDRLIPGEVVVLTAEGQSTRTTDAPGFPTSQFVYWLNDDRIVPVDGRIPPIDVSHSCNEPIGGELTCDGGPVKTDSNRWEVTIPEPLVADDELVIWAIAGVCPTCNVSWTYVGQPADPAVTAEGSGDEPPGGSTAGEPEPDSAAAGAGGEAESDGDGGLPAGMIAVLVALVAAGLVGLAAWLRARARRNLPDDGEDSDEEDEEPEEVLLELTYPAGYSPNVFQYGWVFGAKAVVAPGTPEERDVSDTVRWSGDATFNPPVGRITRPLFEWNGRAKNRMPTGKPVGRVLTLSVETDRVTELSYTVSVISTAGYARVGDKSKCGADAHGCPACPHPTVGPILTGSPTVLIDGLPAAREGDPGVHAACCANNMYTIGKIEDRSVLIDGKPAARLGSPTVHCGGTGEVTTGSGGGPP